MSRFIKYQASGQFIEPTMDSMRAIEAWIRWCEYEVPHELPIAMNELTKMMALVNQGEARKMSFGPHDPFQKNSGAAWKLPVRRITERYYLGWKVRSRGFGVWELYNDSREAYFIEFGISEVGWGAGRHVPARRIRRPVRKLSLRRTLEFMMRTRSYHRVWANIFANPRYRHSHGQGFTQQVQSPGAGSLTGYVRPLP